MSEVTDRVIICGTCKTLVAKYPPDTLVIVTPFTVVVTCNACLAKRQEYAKQVRELISGPWGDAVFGREPIEGGPT